MQIKTIKSHFPIFKTHPGLVYLDSAATTQTPQTVLDAMNDYYTRYRANVHRGLYDISLRASEAYEAARSSLAEFINASPEEITFTAGATHGLNALTYTLCPRLTHRDNVVLTRLEHHANLVPWQQMAKRYGFEIRFIELNGVHQATDYRLNLESAARVIDTNTKIVSFTLASNVLGTVNPAQKIIALARAVRAMTVVDAAQAVAHFPINVKDLDCDWLVFSGHKMYGPTGIGVLYGKKIMLEEQLEPFLFGGEMVGDVTFEAATWNEVPFKFEAGTQNIAGALGLGAAVKFIQSIGWKEIIRHERAITENALGKLAPLVTLVGPKEARERLGVFAFTVPGVHPHDVGEIVNRTGVCLRVGHHCAMPLHKMLGLSGTARASVGVYTTEEDISRLIEGIKEVQQIFK